METCVQYYEQQWTEVHTSLGGDGSTGTVDPGQHCSCKVTMVMDFDHQALVMQ